MPKLILGADGGNSKTHFALADEGGRLRAFVEGGPSNHETKGFGPVLRVFRDMLGRALRQAGGRPGDIKAACLGLAGTDIAVDVPQTIRHAIKPLGLGGPAEVFNDAFIPLFNDRFRTRGVVVNAGMGLKWLGINGKRTHMIEGFTIRGLKAVAIHELSEVGEGIGRPTEHTRALLRFLGFKSHEEFVERWDFGSRVRPYVKPVPARAWRAHDEIPRWLAKRAARGSRGALAALDRFAIELVKGTRGVIDTLGLGRLPFEMLLSGSVIVNIVPLRRAFMRRIRPFAPRARIIGMRARPIRGALNYAAHMAGWQLPAGALAERELWYPGNRP